MEHFHPLGSSPPVRSANPSTGASQVPPPLPSSVRGDSPALAGRACLVDIDQLAPYLPLIAQGTPEQCNTFSKAWKCARKYTDLPQQAALFLELLRTFYPSVTPSNPVDLETSTDQLGSSRSTINTLAREDLPANLGTQENEGLSALVTVANQASDVPEDTGTWLKRLQAAADQGNARAKGRLGVILFYGTSGVEKDTETGLKLLQAAADEGGAYAKGRLGIILFYGISGVEKDTANGLKLLQAAADEGYPRAQQELRRIRQTNNASSSSVGTSSGASRGQKRMATTPPLHAVSQTRSSKTRTKH